MQDGQFTPIQKPTYFQPESIGVQLPTGRGFQDNPQLYDNIVVANQSGFKNWINNFFQGVNDTQIGIAASDLMDGLVKKANTETQLSALDGKFKLKELDEYQYLSEKNHLLDQLYDAYDLVNEAKSSIGEDEADKVKRPTSKAYQWKANRAMLKGPDASLYEQLGYTLPNVAGSSFATLGATMTAGFLGQVAKNVATRALVGSELGPVGTAIGAIAGLATVFGVNAYARNLESKAEIGSQFLSDYQELRGNYLSTKQPGYQLTPEEENKLVLQASKGSNEQYWKNMSLAATDSLQSLIFAGAFTKMLKGFSTASKLSRIGMEVGELYVQKKLEGLEEGLQQAFQYQKHNASMGLKDTESFGKSLLNDYREVLSSMSFLGIQGNGKYKNDQAFQASVNAGELLGIFFGGVKTTMNIASDLNNYRSATKELAALNPTKTDAPVLRLKDEIYKNFFGPKNKFLSTQDAEDRLFFFKEGLKTLNKKLDKEGKPLLSTEELHQELKDIDGAFKTFSKVSDTVDAIIRPYGVNSAQFNLKKGAIRGEIFSNTMALERAKATINQRESEVNQAVDTENLDPKFSNLTMTKANLDIVNKRLDHAFGLREEYLNGEKKRLEKQLKEQQDSYRELENKEAIIPDITQATAKSLELLSDAKENQYEASKKSDELKKVKDNKSLDKWFDSYVKTAGEGAVKAHEDSIIEDNQAYAKTLDRTKELKDLDEAGAKARTKENQDILHRAGYGKTYTDTLTHENLDLEASKILDEFKEGKPLTTEDVVLTTLIEVGKDGKPALTKESLNLLLSRPSFRAKFLALGFNPDDSIENITSQAFEKMKTVYEDRSKNKKRKVKTNEGYTGSVGRVKSSLDKREVSDYEKQFGIQEGKAKQRVVLESIISSVYSTESEKELAKKYLELTGEETIEFGPLPKEGLHSAAGRYNATTDKISIDLEHFGDEYEGNNQAIESAILHELTHKYTVKTMQSDEELRNKVKEMMETAKQQLKGETFRGLENEYEFVTEVMTNPDFQVFLTKSKGKNKRTLWEEFIDAVSAALKRVFNLDISGTLLEDAIELTSDIIGQNAKTGLVAYASTKKQEINDAFGKLDVNSPKALDELSKVHEDVYSDLLNEIAARPALETVREELVNLIHAKTKEYENLIKEARKDNLKVEFKGKTYKKGEFAAIKGYNDAFEITDVKDDKLLLEHKGDQTIKLELSDPEHILFTGNKAEAEYFIQKQKEPKEEETTFTPTAFFKSTGKQIKEGENISEQLDETERRYYNFLNVISKADVSKIPYQGLLIQDRATFNGVEIPHSKETADYLASGGKPGQIVIVVDLNNEPVLFDEQGRPSANGKPVVFNIETPETIMKRDSGKLSKQLKLSIQQVNEIKLEAARKVREARESAAKGVPVLISFKDVSGGISVDDVVDEVTIRPMTETEAQNIVNILTFLETFVNQQLKDFLFHYFEGKEGYDVSGGKVRKNKVVFKATVSDIMTNFRLRKSYKLVQENKPYNIMKVDGKQILVDKQFSSYQEYLQSVSNLNTTLSQDHYNRYVIYQFEGAAKIDEKPSTQRGVEEKKEESKGPKFDDGELFDTPAMREDQYKDLREESKNFKNSLGVKIEPLSDEADEKQINELTKLALEDKNAAINGLGEKAVNILYNWATFNQVYKVYLAKVDQAKRADIGLDVSYLEELMEAKSEKFDSPATNSLQVFNNQTTYYLMRSLDKGIHNYLRLGTAEGDLSYIKTIAEAMEDPAFIIETLDEVKKNLIARLMKSDRPDAETKANKINANWASIVNYYLRNSYVFSFDKSLSFRQDEEGNLLREGDDTVAREKGFDRVGNEISPIDGASKEIKGLIRGLSRFKKVDGKWVKVLNEFNVPDLVNFANTWNNLMKNLQGLETFDDMIAKLDSLVNTFPEYEELLQILRKYYAYAQIGDVEARTMIALFKRDLRKPEVPIIETVVSSENGSTVYKISEATRKNVKELKTQFQANFLAKSPYRSKTSTGNIVLNPKIVNAATAKRVDRVKFFEALGFEFSKETLDDPLFDDLTSASIINLFKRDIQTLTDGKVLIKNPIDDLSKPTKITEGLAKRINQIVDLESKYSKTAPSLSMQNVEGNTEWAISNPNTYTIVIDAVNNVDKYPTFQDLVSVPAFNFLDKPYARTSHALNQIFILDSQVGYGQRRDKVNPVTLRLINNSGLNIENVDGTKTTSLYIGDKIVNDFNQFLKVGYKEGIRAGDKNSAFGIHVSGFYQEGKRLRLPIANFDLFKDSYGGQQMFNIMETYLTGEIARIYLGIHGYMSDISKMDSGSDRLVRDFSLFRDIVPKEIRSEMREKITLAEGIEPNSVEFYGLANSMAKDYITRPEIQEAIINFFKQGIIDKLTSLQKYGFSFKNPYWLDDSLRGYSKETLLKSYIVNEFIMHVEQTKMVNGDVVFYSSKNGEFHKRVPKDGATGLHPITDAWWVEAANLDTNNNLGAKLLGINNQYSNAVRTVVFQESTVPSTYVQIWRDHFRAKGLSEEKIDRIIKPYLVNKEADAQGWITMDFYRNFKLGIGSWTKEQEKIYEQVVKGEALNPEEVEALNRVFPAIKAQYSGHVEHPYYHVPAFHKFSLMPLIPSMIKGTNLEHLNERMLRNNVSYALMESGSKVGTISKGGLESFYKDNKKSTRLVKEPTDEFENYNVIHMAFLKEQVSFEPELHDKVIYGTQFRKLLFQNVYSDGVAPYPKFAKLEQEYSDIIEELTNYHKITLIEEMGLDPVIENGKAVSYNVVNEEKLVNKLIKEVERRKLNVNIRDFFQLENKKLKYPLDASQNNQQIRNLIMSMINSRLIRQNIKGDMMIQASSTGFEKFTKPTEEQKLEYGTNGLRFYYVDNGKTRSMQVKVPFVGDFQNLLQFTWNGEKIGTLAKLNQAIKDENWLAEHRKVVTMLGYRIPTQGLNSMEFMEVAEFLPAEAGNIIIVPPEIVTKAGSDFDIDKLNVFKPTIRFDAKTNEAWYVNRGKKISETRLKKLAERQDILDQRDQINELLRYYNNKFRTSQDLNDLKFISDLKLEQDRLKLELAVFEDEYEEVKSYIGGLTNRIIELGVDRLSDENSFEELITPNSTDLTKPIANNQLGVQAKSYKHTLNLTSLTQEEKYLAGLPNKRALGIAAVANTFSQLLSKNPIELNSEFKGRHVIHPMLKGKKFSLSNKHLESSVLKSEIESQMINAYVDVLNDDFISKANLSFDSAGLFFYLLHLGHNHEQLFYFFNHPVVKETISRNQRSKSLLIKNLQPRAQERKMIRKRADFAKITGLTLEAPNGKAKSLKSLKSEAKDDFNAKYFTMENLKSKLNKPLSELSNSEKRTIAYYLDNVMEESQELLNLQQINNYDTSTSVNPIAHDYREYLKLKVKGEGLFKGDIEGITNNTVIRPFNQYYLISAVLNQLMSVSLSTQVRDSIVDLIREYEDNFDVDLDVEKVTRTLVNDWIAYIHTNFGKTKDGTSLGVHGRNLLFTPEMGRQLVEFKTNDKWAKLREEFPMVDQFRLDKEGDINNISLYRDDNSSDYQNNLIDQFYSLGNYEGGTPEDNLTVKKFFRNLAVLGFSQSGLNKGPFYFTDVIPNEFYVPLMAEAIESYKKLSPQNQKLVYNDFFLRFQGQNPSLFGKPQKEIKTWRYKQYISQAQIKGINISTKSDDSLGRALTNPTWGSQKDGKNYFDVETAYKAKKSKNQNPEQALQEDMNTMHDLIVAKFKQNPELIQEIDKRGGLAFIEASSHEIGVKGSRWEGKGLESNFIKVLARAYNTVKNTQTFDSPARNSQENSLSLGTYNGILKTLLEQGIITPYCD